MPRGRRQRRELSSIPSEGFSDIAFLLIIFFLLATTLQQTSGFKSELPAGEKSEKKSEEKTPTVTLDRQKMRFNDSEVTMKQLRKKLAGLELEEKKDDDKIVLLEAKSDVAYQDYYEVMQAISNAGGAVGIVREASGEEQ